MPGDFSPEGCNKVSTGMISSVLDYCLSVVPDCPISVCRILAGDKTVDTIFIHLFILCVALNEAKCIALLACV